MTLGTAPGVGSGWKADIRGRDLRGGYTGFRDEGLAPSASRIA